MEFKEDPKAMKDWQIHTPINVNSAQDLPIQKKKFKFPNAHRTNATQQTWGKRNDEITNTNRRHKSSISVAPKIQFNSRTLPLFIGHLVKFGNADFNPNNKTYSQFMSTKGKFSSNRQSSTTHCYSNNGFKTVTSGIGRGLQSSNLNDSGNKPKTYS